ncbi:Hpt domain-containing protein [Brachybacterium kimchii]|uniref:Hpt domain-containing protein n=1 Tax=Brachybacterium kimchii TaxID=2942909 RepID=A0ABY4N4R6_9MICO|nr:Hpt domain-containing protein [Brachybacterium kimchii]UQN28075.1 Hpt domain-containing protein [Brachybacterium kimchii]
MAQSALDYWSSSSLLTLVLAGLFFLVLPYAVWGLVYRTVTDQEISRSQCVALGLANLVYVYLTYVYYMRAAWRAVTGRTGWAKTRRNADGRVLADVALGADLTALPLLSIEQLEELAAELDGRSDLGIDFVSGWAIMWPTRTARLERALAAQSPMQTRDAIGSIRVSSAMVGATRLERAAGDLEDALERGDTDAAAAQLPVVTAVGQETVNMLRKEVSVRRELLQVPLMEQPSLTQTQAVPIRRR